MNLSDLGRGEGVAGLQGRPGAPVDEKQTADVR